MMHDWMGEARGRQNKSRGAGRCPAFAAGYRGGEGPGRGAGAVPGGLGGLPWCMKKPRARCLPTKHWRNPFRAAALAHSPHLEYTHPRTNQSKSQWRSVFCSTFCFCPSF